MGTNRKLVIPIRNCKQALVVVSPWSFPDSLFLAEIADEDLGTLLRERPDIFTQTITGRSQCFTALLKPDQEPEQTASDAIAKVQFVFKSLSSVPLVLSHAVVITSDTGQKATIDKVLSLPVWGDYTEQSSNPFAFKEGVNPKDVTDFYEVIDTAVTKHPAFAITLSRFNSCWLRSSEHDKIIDVAISLESLLSSSTEISFKFALFNSFIASKTPKKRKIAFELLQILYNARSKIVHGDTKKPSKDITKAVESLPHILELARAAITYYAFFLYVKNANEWPEHLSNLVFGTAKHIDPNQNTQHEKRKEK
jgi:hypothetical protein